jgi:DNA helicase II / ATP-dependent DNA helicase PcrA
VGGLRILEAPHVKAFIAYLQVLADHRDVLAWGRMLSSAGLGYTEAERLSGVLGRCGNLASACDHLLSTQQQAEKVVALVALLRQAASASPAPADRCAVVAEFFTPILKQHYDDWPDRIENINSICRIAANYSDLPRMLRDLVIDAATTPADKSAADQKDMLTLSTIHSAKGLEWDVVYVMGMTDGVFPDRRSIVEPDVLEEERRLLYVAVTRARRKLMLSSRGGELSRFLRDWRAGSRLTTVGLEPPKRSAAARREFRPAPQAASTQQDVNKPAAGGLGGKGCLLGWLFNLFGPW